MILYLMRHASAGMFRENPTLDSKRGLVKEGKEQCVLMARMLSALKVQVDAVVSSPLKRAMQTAQYVGTELGYDGKVEISKGLLTHRRIRGLPKTCWLNIPGTQGLLAVGHNPILYQFLGRLITGNGGAGYTDAESICCSG